MAFDQLLVAGTTSHLIEVLMRGEADGQPLTPLAVGDVEVWYHRDGAASTVGLGHPAVLANLGTWETDAWKETGVTGLYQYGVPDAALAAGAKGVTLIFTGQGAITAKYRIVLTAINVQDAVRSGMTALPNAVHDAPGGLPTTTKITDARLGALTDWIDGGRLDLLVDALLERLSAARAGYLDNLNVGGNVASQADVQGITQAARIRVCTSPAYERPDSGSTTYRIWIYAYDEQHKAEDLDAAPTVTAHNNVGTDRSANLGGGGTATKPGGTTGQYYIDYTVASDHAVEGLNFKVSAVEGEVTTVYPAATWVVDTTAVDFTAADRTKLEAVHGMLPSVSHLAGSTQETGEVTMTDAAIAQLIDEIWDEVQADHDHVGTFGLYLDGKISEITADAKDWTDEQRAAILASLAAILAKANLIGAATVTYTSPALAGGDFSIVAGDDYRTADGRALIITVTDYSGPDLTAATAAFRLVATADYEAGSRAAALEVAATIAVDGTTVTISIELTAAQTAALAASPPAAHYTYVHQVRIMTATGRILTIGPGSLHVEPGMEAA